MIVRVKQILFIMFGRSVIFVFIHAYIKHDWVKIKQKRNICVYLLHSVYDTNIMNNEVCVNQLLYSAPQIHLFVQFKHSHIVQTKYWL